MTAPLRAVLALFFVSCLPIPAAGAQPVAVTDDRGREVKLARPAQRIVTLAPSLTELAFAAGAGGRLVGVARYSDTPREARAIPQVGDAVRVDFERIAVLRPDLILAWRSGNSAGDVERLEQLGYPAYVSEQRRLADIPRQLRAIGALAGTTPAAEQAAADFERKVDALRKRYASAPSMRSGASRS
jgi:iron complex transport system substrate-binding protein